MAETEARLQEAEQEREGLSRGCTALRALGEGLEADKSALLGKVTIGLVVVYDRAASDAFLGDASLPMLLVDL